MLQTTNLRRLALTAAATISSLTVVSPAVAFADTSENTQAVNQLVASNWIDTTDRQAVIDAYNTEFGAAAVDADWTGDRNSCTAGTTSAAYRASTLSRINWFRAMAGVPATVRESQSLTAKAQETALMNSVSGQISHNPDSSFSCATSTAVAAAAKSNLYLGRTGPDAITGYVQDPGVGNVSAGHRNWILHPTSTEMGIGEIPRDTAGVWATNTLYVIEDTSIVFGPQPELREDQGFVAWPNAGFVPEDVVFDRWSFGLRGANFANASVSVTVDGITAPTSVEFASTSSTGAPFPIMVWNVSGLPTNAAFDTDVVVTIRNVNVNGASKSFSYTTTIIGDQPAPVSADTAALNAFVTSAYSDFLGRNPSSSELYTWTSKLANGTSRLAFVNTLAASDEWTTVVVQDLYVDTLGREADAGGAAYWAKRLQAGTSVATVASQFYGSPEYVSSEGGTYSAWLVDLYSALMGRNPEASGLNYWVGQAEVRGSGQVAYDFYQSEESRRSRVTAMYEIFLGRGPDAGGLTYWAGVLQSGDDLALAGFLASSEEYFIRAG